MTSGNTIKTLGISSKDNVLFVYPHPDDETYCNAGLVQKLIKNKINTKIVCLTKGGASTLAFSVDPNHSLTHVREQEFTSVMKYLGVQNFEIHDLEDGNLSNQVREVKTAISNEIDKYGPSFIITYEPQGIYGHKDHIVVSACATELAKEKGISLIYTTVAQNYKSSKESLSMADAPSKVVPIEPTNKLRLSLFEFITKLKALSMYKSQISAKHETGHKVYQAMQMLNEYYHTC